MLQGNGLDLISLGGERFRKEHTPNSVWGNANLKILLMSGRVINL